MANVSLAAAGQFIIVRMSILDDKIFVDSVPIRYELSGRCRATHHDNQSINMYRDNRKHQIKLEKKNTIHSSILLSISWYQINKRATEPELILEYLDIQVPTIKCTWKIFIYLSIHLVVFSLEMNANELKWMYTSICESRSASTDWLRDSKDLSQIDLFEILLLEQVKCIQLAWRLPKHWICFEYWCILIVCIIVRDWN